jgi:hypothetical protein
MSALTDMMRDPLPAANEIGAANRIMFLNRVLGETARLYQATAICSLPRVQSRGLGSVGGNTTSR